MASLKLPLVLGETETAQSASDPGMRLAELLGRLPPTARDGLAVVLGQLEHLVTAPGLSDSERRRVAASVVMLRGTTPDDWPAGPSSDAD